MPNAIRFEIHHPTRARRARVTATPPRRAGTRSEVSTTRRLARILVATDGTSASEGAVIMAGLLSHVGITPAWMW